MFWFRWKHPIKLAVIVLLCVACWFGFYPLEKKISLGLDLQGGVRALVDEGAAWCAPMHEIAAELLERR